MIFTGSDVSTLKATFCSLTRNSNVSISLMAVLLLSMLPMLPKVLLSSSLPPLLVTILLFTYVITERQCIIKFERVINTAPMASMKIVLSLSLLSSVGSGFVLLLAILGPVLAIALFNVTELSVLYRVGSFLYGSIMATAAIATVISTRNTTQKYHSQYLHCQEETHDKGSLCS